MKFMNYTSSPLSGQHNRNGVAVLLVLAIVAITLALAFALSQSSSTMAQLSAHETCGLEARSAVESSVGTTLSSLQSNPNWLPAHSPVKGALVSGERYQVGVQITHEGGGRSIDAAAQVFDSKRTDTSTIQNESLNATGQRLKIADPRPLADQHLRISLTKQTRSDLPRAAIDAYATRVNSSSGSPVYIARGTSVRGNVRSKGPIQFQAGFVLEGKPYVMGDVSRAGTDASGYSTYRTSWGMTYQAALLTEHGKVDSAGRLFLDNVVLGPSSTNPMGVYYYRGSEVVLGDNVQVNGTLAVRGNLTISGTEIHLTALQQVEEPASESESGGLVPGVGVGGLLSKAPLESITLEGRAVLAIPEAIESGSGNKTCFPAVVVDESIVFQETADAVRVFGVLVAGRNVQRLQGTTHSLVCSHDHSLRIDAIDNPLASVDGPAIYIQGAIVASRVSLQHRKERPLVLVYDSAATNVGDAPGFFTWRVTEWTEAN